VVIQKKQNQPHRRKYLPVSKKRDVATIIKDATKKAVAKATATAALDQPTRRTVEKLLKNLCSGRHDWCEKSDDPLKERRDNVRHDLVDLERKLHVRFVENNPKVKALREVLSVVNSFYELAKGEIAVKALAVQEKYQAQGITPEVTKDLKDLVAFAHNYRENLLLAVKKKGRVMDLKAKVKRGKR
jgi:hypothetical protein